MTTALWPCTGISQSCSESPGPSLPHELPIPCPQHGHRSPETPSPSHLSTSVPHAGRPAQTVPRLLRTSLPLRLGPSLPRESDLSYTPSVPALLGVQTSLTQSLRSPPRHLPDSERPAHLSCLFFPSYQTIVTCGREMLPRFHLSN